MLLFFIFFKKIIYICSKKMATKYKLAQSYQVPHIGKLIFDFFHLHKIKSAFVARKMNRAPITVSRYRKNASIQIGILLEICYVVKHNFFMDIAATLPADFTTQAPALEALLIAEKEIEELKKQLLIACSERDILVKTFQK